MTTSNTRRKARCSVPECNKLVQSRGRCKAHGGGVRCKDPDCHKFAQSQGRCVAHGGGRRCASDGCGKLAQQKGFCLSHGGGKRCRVEGCQKYVQLRGCCKAHARRLLEMEDAAQALEVSWKDHTPKLSIDFLANPLRTQSARYDPTVPNLPAAVPRDYPHIDDRQNLNCTSKIAVDNSRSLLRMRPGMFPRYRETCYTHELKLAPQVTSKFTYLDISL